MVAACPGPVTAGIGAVYFGPAVRDVRQSEVSPSPAPAVMAAAQLNTAAAAWAWIRSPLLYIDPAQN